MTDKQSRPIIPVQRPIVNRFAQVYRGDGIAFIQIGDRAADAEDFVVGAGRKAHFFHGRF